MMLRSKGIHSGPRHALIGTASAAVIAIATAAYANEHEAKLALDIPSQPLASALKSVSVMTDNQVLFSEDLVAGHYAPKVKGEYSANEALSLLVKGTGLSVAQSSDRVFLITAKQPVRVAANTSRPAAASAPEVVTVTAQRVREDIQNVPIAVSAFSQKQLTERQIATGGDLIRETPNMNFSKTNFSGYSIELRGIGTQAISVTTDPAVAVAFNGTPFIRNHFFEQEFFDVESVEVLRGPQGTLWGRNATAGVVNLMSAKPTDTYEAVASVDFGNYNNRRFEGMLNLPIVGDKLDLRIAGEWTKRDGYTTDVLTNSQVDGRDLWSGRMTLGWKPSSNVEVDLVWEHFSEDDNRMRTAKQLCETAQSPTEVDGVPVGNSGNRVQDPRGYLSQGCVPTSLYSPNAFEVPNGNSLAYYQGFAQIGAPLQGGYYNDFDPYASTTQSQNLRIIETRLSPTYRAKNDALELNANYAINPSLTLTSQTGFNNDFLWSSEDYNRFDTVPGAFAYCNPDGSTTGDLCGLNPNRLSQLTPDPLAGKNGVPQNAGIFCDPQLGCSDRLVLQDLSDEHSWQLNQEFRLASNFSSPFNFSVGGNYLHYETEENYYVFINTVSLASVSYNPSGGGPFLPYVPGVTDNLYCSPGGAADSNPSRPSNPQNSGCVYVDPNPLTSLNNEGHNYFLSQNPYTLNSYAAFGEAYYNILNDLKLTAGVRWTDDQKHFVDIPSELFVKGYGYPVTGVVDQSWGRFTGRAVLDWTPKLDFTDQTLLYASYSHGYKAGGANPPGAVLLVNRGGDISNPIHPLTFKPEYIEAFELGTKNTLLDGSLTLNGDVFYYNYTGYQISRIVDRTSINDNFNAHIEGAELESTWEPTPGLKFSFAGGYEDSRVGNGQSSVDLMDRADAANHPDWIVVKRFVTQASNCILPTYVVAAMLEAYTPMVSTACGVAYDQHNDPVTGLPYVPNPTVAFGGGQFVIPPGYVGFNPATAPNNGEGFAKNLSNHQLPNAPPFTASFTAEYTIPVSQNWAATLHGDFYWQADSWARIFNDNPYDRLHGYTNVNLSLILNSADGWQVMGYVKNIFDTTAITGDFLNSDDSGLTTNVFLTDPRLFGVRVTKHLDQDDGFSGSEYSGYNLFTDLIADADNGKPPLWIELGGNFMQLADGHQSLDAPFFAAIPASYGSQITSQKAPTTGLDWETKVSFEPDGSDWVFSASARYGRSSRDTHVHHQTNMTRDTVIGTAIFRVQYQARYEQAQSNDSESHAILDFTAGKNVGLGSLGLDGNVLLSGGARYAAFDSSSGFNIDTVPDSAEHQTGPKYRYHSDHGSLHAKRSFHGIGPTVKLEGSTPFAGNEQDGELTFDWGANGAVLFGRQRAAGTHTTKGAYYCYNDAIGYRTAACPVATPNALPPYGDRGRAHNGQISHYQRTNVFNRSRMVAVPNFGAFAGLSVRYPSARISFGYRVDEFFGAMDGGIDTSKTYDRGFYGPFAKISIGIGG